MNCVDVRDLRRAHNRGNVQVAASALRRPDADRLIRETDVESK